MAGAITFTGIVYAVLGVLLLVSWWFLLEMNDREDF